MRCQIEIPVDRFIRLHHRAVIDLKFKAIAPTIPQPNGRGAAFGRPF
ncbi:MAG: hypothetical protein HY785_05055 [Oscillatoriophycideae cyanobacterium NC_groundwater_1537_Pr4_S-0.65um_50_18]|nr:hypothetical protein [Oscillatoriophycideae cyanobacterium NC_groundwater_1537_Pr4_S-0.65um_50_18]